MSRSLVTSGVIVGIVLSCVGTNIVFGISGTFGQSSMISPEKTGERISFQNSSFVIGPYTQQSQQNSIIVSWETQTPTTRNEVQWGLTGDLGNTTVEKNNFANTFHTITLQGLIASTMYYYIVVSDDAKSAPYTFFTSFQKNDEVRFVVYGDSRGGWDNWASTKIVGQAIEAANPPFVISTGDLVDNGTNANDWVNFFAASPFVHNSTIYPTLGNHEGYSKLYFSYFSLSHNERWYSFDDGPVHFIGLDSNPRNAYRLVQLVWLIHDLRTNSQPFTIVFFHHPLYSSGNHGNATLLRMIWKPIFEHFTVDIVFNGHDHDYERSVVGDITYVVTGGGGAPLYDVGHNPWTVYSEKTYHYCLLTVNSSLLTFEAIKPDGTVFDSFMIPK
jgi:acid phosphatase type 7